MPFISIVIPTYNHAKYLSKALRSILDQSFQNWEAIVIDNHSADETIKIIRSYNDPRIKYLKISNNGVVAKSRNAGIKLAKGKWIAFLDSDDWWVKNKLKICYDIIKKKNKVDLIYHDLKIASNENSLFNLRKIKGRKLKKPIIIDLLINGNPISNSSVVVKKELLKKVGLINEDKKFIAAEDYNTWLKISKVTNNFYYLPYCLGYYLKHTNNLSNKNMAIPKKFAVSEFLYLLTYKQKLNLKSQLTYISARYNYFNHNYEKSKKELFFALFNGKLNLKIRALIRIFILYFLPKN